MTKTKLDGFDMLEAYQARQMKHDSTHHLDVLILPPAQRLQHYVTHLAKYSNAFHSIKEGETILNMRVCSALCVTLAAANVSRTSLKMWAVHTYIDFDKEMGHPDIDEVIATISKTVADPVSNDPFFTKYIYPLSGMAIGADSLYHIKDDASIKDVRLAVFQMFFILAKYLQDQGIAVEKAMKHAHDAVEIGDKTPT